MLAKTPLNMSKQAVLAGGVLLFAVQVGVVCTTTQCPTGYTTGNEMILHLRGHANDFMQRIAWRYDNAMELTQCSYLQSGAVTSTGLDTYTHYIPRRGVNLFFYKMNPFSCCLTVALS